MCIRDREQTEEEVEVSIVRITDEEGEKAVGKPRGSYVTLTAPHMAGSDPEIDKRCAKALAKQIRAMMPKKNKQRPVLLVGLGNRSMTPDSLGPRTDVYKRQEHGTMRPLCVALCADGTSLAWVCRAGRGGCIVCLYGGQPCHACVGGVGKTGRCIAVRRALYPVSYTHLDVYKRQVLNTLI